MPLIVYFLGMHGIGFGFIKIYELLKTTRYGRKFMNFRVDYFSQDSRKSSCDDFLEGLPCSRLLSYLWELLQSFYKLSMVVLFLCLCLLIGAIFTLIALIPTYILFIWIIYRVNSNWSRHSHAKVN